MSKPTFISSSNGYMQDLQQRISTATVESYGNQKAVIQTTITPRFILALQQAITGELDLSTLTDTNVSKQTRDILTSLNKMKPGCDSDRVQINFGHPFCIKLDKRIENADRSVAAAYTSTLIETTSVMNSIVQMLSEHIPLFLATSFDTMFKNEVSGLDNLITFHRSCLNFAIMYGLKQSHALMTLIDIIACTCQTLDVPSLQLIKLLGAGSMVKTINSAIKHSYQDTDEFTFGRSLRSEGSSISVFFKNAPQKVTFTQYVRSFGTSTALQFDQDGNILTAPIASHASDILGSPSQSKTPAPQGGVHLDEEIIQ